MIAVTHNGMLVTRVEPRAEGYVLIDRAPERGHRRAQRARAAVGGRRGLKAGASALRARGRRRGAGGPGARRGCVDVRGAPRGRPVRQLDAHRERGRDGLGGRRRGDRVARGRARGAPPPARDERRAHDPRRPRPARAPGVLAAPARGIRPLAISLLGTTRWNTTGQFGLYGSRLRFEFRVPIWRLALLGQVEGGAEYGHVTHPRGAGSAQVFDVPGFVRFGLAYPLGVFSPGIAAGGGVRYVIAEAHAPQGTVASGRASVSFGFSAAVSGRLRLGPTLLSLEAGVESGSLDGPVRSTLLWLYGAIGWASCCNHCSLALAFAASPGCGAPGETSRVVSVSPATFEEGTTTAIAVQVEGMAPLPGFDLDRGLATSDFAGEVRLEPGNRLLATTRESFDRFGAIVPPLVPPGRYDIVVSTTGNRVARLAGALRISGSTPDRLDQHRRRGCWSAPASRCRRRHPQPRSRHRLRSWRASSATASTARGPSSMREARALGRSRRAARGACSSS